MPTDGSALSALALSEEDVRHLLEDTSGAVRVGMTEKIASAYGGNKLHESELLIAEQIFRLLVRDTEVRVRVSLAEHLKNSGEVPRDIVMSLAQDVAEVSLPVLQYSEVLNDDDLVELIANTHEISRYLAISKRKEVSDVVSETLLEKGDDQVVEALVSNEGAAISENGFNKIIQTHGSDGRLMKAISDRPRLPMAAAEKLVHVVSSTLADQLKKKYKLPGEQIHREAEKTREGETLHLIRDARSQDEIDKLITQLVTFDRLSPSLILSALCQGDFAFFETSLARLSNIPVANARALITDRGELGFRAIYNKSGLPDAMFPAVKLLLRVVRELDAQGGKPGLPRYANSVVERILQYSEDTQIENLSYIIALVRKAGQ